jgi:electron transport complex protein RnfA
MVGAILVNNFVLSRFLGVCPYVGVSRKTDTAVGMSMAVVFVMTMASAISWLVQHLLLVPLQIQYLRTIAFILVIAALVQLTEMTIQKVSPILYGALGIYLPLITTNCAVLGVSILNIQKDHTFPQACVFGFSAALGFGLALVLFAGLRERLELVEVPRPFRGAPIALITAGLLSLGFLGFAGLVK